MATRAPALASYKAVDGGKLKAVIPFDRLPVFESHKGAKHVATQGDCICIFCKGRWGKMNTGISVK